MKKPGPESGYMYIYNLPRIRVPAAYCTPPISCGVCVSLPWLVLSLVLKVVIYIYSRVSLKDVTTYYCTTTHSVPDSAASRGIIWPHT